MNPEGHNRATIEAERSLAVSGPPARWRVLVFPGATEIALEIRHALAWRKEIVLFSAGTAASNHAPYVFARHFVLPTIGEPGWRDALAQLIADERITHVFPAHDDAVTELAETAPLLGATVIGSPASTCRTVRSKSETIRRLHGVVPTPALFRTPDDVTSFPVFVKPDRGQGSQGIALARDAAELRAQLRLERDRIVQEFLPGAEYTVDCFSDRDAGLLYARGRERRRIRSGIAMDCVSVDDPRLLEYAQRINSVLALYGAWFFQVREDRNGVLKLLEVAPRIGGTSALSRAGGVNLPLLSLYEAERIPVRVSPNGADIQIDRALINRYRHSLVYRTLYVDFDDTLVVRGQINAELVKLIFQAINRGIRVVLLTRHDGDLDGTLRRYRLRELFDTVVHIRDGACKADFIDDPDSIFIDDSFSERMAVYRRREIPVFDSGMIEVLFDERI